MANVELDRVVGIRRVAVQAALAREPHHLPQILAVGWDLFVTFGQFRPWSNVLLWALV